MSLINTIGSLFTPPEQRIASDALAQYESIRDSGGSAAQFDSVALDAIHQIQNDSYDSTAATLARVSETAYQRLTPEQNSAAPCADVLRSCLQICAAPINAPVGIALAKVGATALSESDIGITAPAACSIGLTFTHAINDMTADGDERNHAAATLAQYASTQPLPDSAGQCAYLLKSFLVADAQRG